MSTSHVDEALQKAARLRRQVEGLEPRATKRPRLATRIYRGFRRGLVCVVVGLLVVDGLFAYRAFHGDGATSNGAKSSVADRPTYSDLKVFADAGIFAGGVAITNPFDHDIWVMVTVNVYDGDQAVGDLSGSVTLKPNSTSRVDLTGVDPFLPFTDSRVHLSGFADPAS